MIVLSVSATTRGVGYVAVEDRYLLDWAVMRFSSPSSTERILEHLLNMIDLGDVELVLLPERHARVGTKAEQFLREFSAHLKGRQIAFKSVDQRAFPKWSSRHERAVALARKIPELRGFLPRQRKLWESESSNLVIFDAASLLETEGQV